MATSTTTLYSTTTSNLALSSNNLTTLYPGASGGITPQQPYGNANVVSLLLNTTDGANTIGNINTTANGYITTGTLSVNNFLTVNSTGNNAGAALIVDGTGQFSGDFGVGGSTTLTDVYASSATLGILNVTDFTQTSTTPSNFLGNVVSNQFFIGNGYYLTGVGNGGGGGSGSSISNGTSNVTVAPNGNVTVTISGSLITTFATTGQIINGIVSASGNVRGSNLNTSGIVSATGNVIGSYFIGNGSALTGITATTVGVLPSLSVTGNTQTGNLLTGGLVSATGNVIGGSLNTSGIVSAAGNIVAGQFFVGNGSALTGVQATGVGVLASLSVTGTTQTGNLLTGGNVSATGNITGNNLSITNLASVTGNLTVGGVINLNNIDTAGSIQTNYLASNTAVVAGTYMSAAGNITGNNFFANTITSTGSITTNGSISALGNVTANVDLSALGNVTIGGVTSHGIGWNSTTASIKLTSISPPELTVSAVTTYFSNPAGASISVANNVTANIVSATTLSASGNVLAGTRVSSGGNVLGTNLLASQTMSATGNITGGNVIGPSGSSAVGVVNYRDYVATITYASTITPNIAEGSIQQVTLTGNVTMNAFGGTPQAGQSLVIKLIQDSTGGRILTSTMKWAGGNKTLSTAGNAVDIASIFFDGSTYYASLTTAYA
jgi:hypothetical protein